MEHVERLEAFGELFVSLCGRCDKDGQDGGGMEGQAWQFHGVVLSVGIGIRSTQDTARAGTGPSSFRRNVPGSRCEVCGGAGAIGTPEVRELLENLAGGAAGARQTCEAKSTMERLAKCSRHVEMNRDDTTQARSGGCRVVQAITSCLQTP